MTDRIARSLSLLAIALSFSALALVFSRQWVIKTNTTVPVPLETWQSQAQDDMPLSSENTLKKQSEVASGRRPEEALPQKLQEMEQDLESLKHGLDKTEKTFYFTVDPHAPDFEEQYFDQEAQQEIVSKYVVIPLSEFGESVQEVLEVRYRNRNQWYVYDDRNWEVREQKLFIMVGFLFDIAPIKVIYR